MEAEAKAIGVEAEAVENALLPLPGIDTIILSIFLGEILYLFMFEKNTKMKTHNFIIV